MRTRQTQLGKMIWSSLSISPHSFSFSNLTLKKIIYLKAFMLPRFENLQSLKAHPDVSNWTENFP